MNGVNKVILVGTLGRDPEVKYGSNGNAIVNLSLATSETWKDKNSGEKQEKTEWHRGVIFGKLAEIAAEYLKKGSQAYFEGKLQTRKWQDKDGQDRYTTEIVANQMQMLGGKGMKTSADDDKQSAPSSQPQPATTFEDDQIPFIDPYKFNSLIV